MGILNVTPDSFSDGGRFLDPDRAVAHALKMEADGAGIIDIGGESTRPLGAREVPVTEELARVLPVFVKLAGKLRIPISIDTRHAAVASAALDAGAQIINDISALGDPAMARLAAKSKCAVVLMHMRGGPEDHIKFARYNNVVGEVSSYLAERARSAIAAGIPRSRIILDPGIGFAKTTAHNLELIANLPRLCAMGYPVLVGASRKTFVRKIAGASADELRFGTVAVDAIAIANGASIVRVHEVGPARAAVAMASAIARGASG
ncbi:MAG TPA: dihydropteroate synthase [Candidatus Binataceae bacterium]|nr:dihydropteroate synthase [Candidatus Binataceae bacterium]